MRHSARGLIVGLGVMAFVCGGRPTDATGPLAGPVAADVVRVIDGDSIEVSARLWLGLDLTVEVRVRGIDAPETGSRAGCLSERRMGRAATERLRQLAVGELRLTNIATDKYGGRVDADVTNGDGIDIRSAMLASGLARAYGGGKRSDWCELAGLVGN